MVLGVNRRQRVWLAQHKVDFRKGHSGLLAEAYKMSLDPFLGDVVIFIGRNRRRLKVLFADPTGVWISSKLFTLEAMKTRLNFLVDPSCKSISQAELLLLIEGAAYTIDKKVATYTKPVDSLRGSLAAS
jgi:hypothetical protein